MKRTFLIIFALILSTNIFAQGAKMTQIEINNLFEKEVSFKPSGYYSGKLVLDSYNELPIVFEFKEDKIYFSSPSQNAFDLEISYKLENNSYITITAPQFGFSLKGTISSEKIVGTFFQSGFEIKTELIHGDDLSQVESNRWQEPTAFNYSRNEVVINSILNGRKYYGTLTIPNNTSKKTGIIFVTGSGVQDRNEEIMSHKPFLVISDFLTNNGYHTLRCDDYGFHGEDISNDTTFDISNDIKAQIEYLKENTNLEKVVLFGHSEGALVAQILADKVDSIILMASPSVSGRETYKFQLQHALRTGGVSEEVISSLDKTIDTVTGTLIDDTLSLKEKQNIVIPFLKSLGNDDSSALSVFSVLNSPWYRTFLKLDPREYIKKIKVPTLVLQGSNDTQVDEKLNIPVFEKLLKGRNKIIVYPKYNHLLQKSITGELKEYYEIGTTIEEDVLKDVLEFLNSLQ